MMFTCSLKLLVFILQVEVNFNTVISKLNIFTMLILSKRLIWTVLEKFYIDYI